MRNQGITHEEMARRLGVSKSTVSNQLLSPDWRMSTFLKYTRVLGMSVYVNSYLDGRMTQLESTLVRRKRKSDMNDKAKVQAEK